MFYETQLGLTPDGLSHNPFPALVAPRPIAWITTVGHDGCVNVAPFSHFNIASVDPPMVMFAPSDKGPANAPKDTLRNLSERPEFVVNVATWDMREAVNASSAPFDYGHSELSHCGLTPVPSALVAPPRIAGAPAALECRVYESIRLPQGRRGRGATVVIGEVVGIYIDDRTIVDGRVDAVRLAQIARLGYLDYCVVTGTFEMQKPRA